MSSKIRMKHFFLYFFTTVASLIGFLMIIVGFLFLPSAHPSDLRRIWWQVISLGMVLVGISALLNLEWIPDYVPAWVKRYFAPIYSVFWLIAGIVVFMLSWL